MIYSNNRNQPQHNGRHKFYTVNSTAFNIYTKLRKQSKCHAAIAHRTLPSKYRSEQTHPRSYPTQRDLIL